MEKVQMIRAMVMLAAIMLISCQPLSEVPVNSTDEQYLVTKVVDGDTIELQNGRRVRLICVDTPEKGKPFFKEATNFTRDLVLNKVVTLEKDVSETDRYGRLLRYVYVGNISVNYELVANGMAMVYRYPPDVEHCDEYQEAAKFAAEHGVGLWDNG
jgi:micrococcal nuclease